MKSIAGQLRDPRKPDRIRYFPTIKRMDDDLATCEKALKLAEGLNDPALIGESRVIEGHVQMIKSIYVIVDMVAGKRTSSRRTGTCNTVKGDDHALAIRLTDRYWPGGIYPGRRQRCGW
jgi:hypothetical protein